MKVSLVLEQVSRFKFSGKSVKDPEQVLEHWLEPQIEFEFHFMDHDGQQRTYRERSQYLVNVKSQYEELGRLIAVAEKLQAEYGLGEELTGGWNSQETWSMDRTKEPPGTQFRG